MLLPTNLKFREYKYCRSNIMDIYPSAGCVLGVWLATATRFGTVRGKISNYS